MIIEKGIYPGGRKKCLLFSYDDNRADNLEIADLFRQFGLRATFNFNGGSLLEDGVAQNGTRPCLHKTDVQKLSEDFEIACHGFRHPPYGYMDTAQCADDLLQDRKMLESILRRPVRGFALPCGMFNADTSALLRSCGMVYCRTIDNTGGFELPKDFMRWNPTVKHDDWDKLFERGEAYLKGSWRLNHYLSCMLVYGHSYELAEPEKRRKFTEFLRMMAGKEDIWYATCMELYDYVQAMNGLVMTVDGSCVINPSLTDVWVTVNNRLVCISAGETRCFD